jgi:hypothetical protein
MSLNRDLFFFFLLRKPRRQSNPKPATWAVFTYVASLNVRPPSHPLAAAPRASSRALPNLSRSPPPHRRRRSCRVRLSVLHNCSPPRHRQTRRIHPPRAPLLLPPSPPRGASLISLTTPQQSRGLKSQQRPAAEIVGMHLCDRMTSHRRRGQAPTRALHPLMSMCVEHQHQIVSGWTPSPSKFADQVQPPSNSFHPQSPKVSSEGDTGGGVSQQRAVAAAGERRRDLRRAASSCRRPIRRKPSRVEERRCCSNPPRCGVDLAVLKLLTGRGSSSMGARAPTCGDRAPRGKGSAALGGGDCNRP